jgi:hypothetical protein
LTQYQDLKEIKQDIWVKYGEIFGKYEISEADYPNLAVESFKFIQIGKPKTNNETSKQINNANYLNDKELFLKFFKETKNFSYKFQKIFKLSYKTCIEPQIKTVSTPNFATRFFKLISIGIPETEVVKAETETNSMKLIGPPLDRKNGKSRQEKQNIEFHNFRKTK